MKTLRNAVILTALGATATAIVIMPMDSNEATPVPGVVVTPQTTPSASPTADASKSAAPSASPSDTATPERSDKAAEDKTMDDDAAPAPERAEPAQVPAPAAPAPVEYPAAPPAPAPVPQAPALNSVCEWDDDGWECDDDWDDD